VGWGGRRVRRNVFLAPLFSDDYFKVERLRFSRGFRVAIPAVYCDFRMGQSLRRHVVTTKNIISGFGYTLCCVVLCFVLCLCGYVLYGILYMVNALITQSLNHSIRLS
jgi:hypothetical protein